MLGPRYLLKILLLMTVLLSSFDGYGQSNSLAIETTDAYCQNNGAAVPLSALASIEGPDDDVLEGVQVSITKNFDPQVDSFTYTFADDIQGDFDLQNGIFTLSGRAPIQAYRKALDRLYFNTAEENTEPKTLNITLSGVDFLASTGHFYQFFSATGISWSNAKAAAESQNLFGLQGYLTTITSAEENKFIVERVSGTAWIGASDEEEEGIWKWVTGPEAGTIFWEGLANGTAIGYANWQPQSSSSSGEPNQSGNEDYAHMMSWTNPSGQWNDLADGGGGGNYTPTGYIVEYGGQDGDPNILDEISGNAVIEPKQKIELIGPTSVCPNVEGVIYNATALDAHTYSWTIEGGTIIDGETTDAPTVKWGDTNANAQIRVLVTSNLACTYETILNVRINEELEPPAPTGPLAICFDDHFNPQVYGTPATPGSNYTWHVTNGQIISGNGTNEVEVLWDGPVEGALYFTESTTTATDICDGDSPEIRVIIKEAITVDFDIQNVTCFNGNDGAAHVNLTSSASNISYEWIVPNDAQIQEDRVSSLKAGTYELLIIADDCSKYFSFEITEPAILAGDLSIENVRCHGEANGFASAQITGGTGDYNYSWSHDEMASLETVNNLPAGNHSVRIVDENNCELTLNFTINEPAPLVVEEIISTLVSCPDGNDGSLEAIVSGGTSPYTFIWEDNTTSSALATGYEKGSYELIVVDANGCQVNAEQSVQEAIPKVVLPNAFTPNEDGMNDTFGPTTPCDIVFRMEIYNRWGQIIFVSNSSVDHWDGTFKDKILESGKYNYAASWVIEANDQVIAGRKRGEIHLIR